MLRKKKALFALSVVAAVLAGCDSPPNNGSQAGQTAPPSNDTLVYPMNWTEMVVNAYGINLHVDGTGHFDTVGSTCAGGQGGAYSIQDWNPYATLLNAIVASPALPEERCRDYYDDYENHRYFYWTGSGTTAVIQTTNGPRTLYEIRNFQLCTTISDAKLDGQLLDRIEAGLEAADKMGCPTNPAG